jgi:hypothetical protein
MSIGRACLGLLVSGISVALWFLVPWSFGVPSGAGGPIVAPSSGKGAPPISSIHGISGCSAKACHGGPAPADSKDETTKSSYAFTHWINHDKHADAYRNLFNERSVRIAKNLAVDGKIVPAHEDVRCLACHTIPQTAFGEPGDSWTLNLRREGVGCEACHGPAEGTWLRAHTTSEFNNPTSIKANCDKYAMTWLNTFPKRAQVCTGCHVGAAADPDKNLPLRDVNHDLIAAGHPRLDFELSTYMANLTPHWVEKDRTKPGPDNLLSKLDPGYEAHIWTAGQEATAKASVNLLEYHAGPAYGTWPEFAEHDCYACHHDLRGKSWRVEAQEYYKGRVPGALPINPWNLSLPLRMLVSGSADEKVEMLRLAMSKLPPARKDVEALAKSTSPGFKVQAPTTPAAITKMMVDLIPSEDKAINDLTWDDCAQIYYALRALDMARQSPNQAFRKALEGFGKQLMFTPSPTETQNDSPLDFRGTAPATGEELRKSMKDLRRSIK